MKIDIDQLQYIHHKLRAMCLHIEELTGLEFTITSQYRIGDSGVHGQMPLRGIDLRMRSIAVGHEIVALINNNWVYDATRPDMKCAILHGEGANMHIHLQVHPRTEKV